MHISLAAKCRILFGLAVLVIMGIALVMPWLRMEDLVEQVLLESLSQLSVEEVRLMVEEARRWRVDVAAHAYGGEGAYNAVAGGVRSLEHGMFLDDPTLDLMVERGTFWSPTMSVYFPETNDPPDEREFRNRIVERHRDILR